MRAQIVLLSYINANYWRIDNFTFNRLIEENPILIIIDRLAD